MDLLCAELEQFKELLKAEGVGEETSSVFTLLHCAPPGKKHSYLISKTYR